MSDSSSKKRQIIKYEIVVYGTPSKQKFIFDILWAVVVNCKQMFLKHGIEGIDFKNIRLHENEQ